MSFDGGKLKTTFDRQFTVSQSVNLQPTDSTTSASRVHSFAAREPDLPICPKLSGSVSGIRPFAIRLVTIAILYLLDRASISGSASELSAPPPTTMSGFDADRSNSAAFLIAI